MDARKLTELLRATIDPAQQKEAEGQLTQVGEKIRKRADQGENVLARFRPAAGPRGEREGGDGFPSISGNMWPPFQVTPRVPDFHASCTCAKSQDASSSRIMPACLPSFPPPKVGGSPLPRQTPIFLVAQVAAATSAR